MEKYGVKWSQLDAPRHIFIPTKKGIGMLANLTGFVIEKFKYDTTDFAIWSSELYKLDIPLSEAKSQLKNPKPELFKDEDIAAFKKIAAQINKDSNGDIAAIYLKKA